MWTQLQTNNLVQPRLVSDHELQALLGDTSEDVAQPYAKSLPLSLGRRGNPLRNQILSALSEVNYDMVKDALELVNLTAGQVIYESDDLVQQVYFPTTCTASLLSTTAEGETVELALTGRNGLIGVSLVLGGSSMGHSVQIRSSGQAYRMSTAHFERLLRECGQFQQLALSYVQSLMTQMAQSIVCSRHHSVIERLSQWMLCNADGWGSDELTVTHETIAHMLGVRRESVTQAAGKLQAQGFIRNSRGKITIQNREGLLQSVCECYGHLQSDSAAYMQRLRRLTHLSADSESSFVMHSNGDEAGHHDFQKYIDAYDFAPVGFVTLDALGLVMQTNLAGAIMLDIQRSQCQDRAFMGFLCENSRASFMQFHQEVLSGQCRRFLVVNLPATAHRAAMTLRIDATSDEEGQENRMVMIDIGSGYPIDGHAEAQMPSTWQFQTHSAVGHGALNR